MSHAVPPEFLPSIPYSPPPVVPHGPPAVCQQGGDIQVKDHHRYSQLVGGHLAALYDNKCAGQVSPHFVKIPVL